MNKKFMTNNNFSKPLSEKEESNYLSRCKNGDAYAKDKLIEHNLRLVVYIARRYESTGLDLDDLVSIGTIGLIKAVSTYNSEKNTKFATYASRCIDNEILMVLRKEKGKRKEISFEEPISTDKDGDSMTLKEILFDPLYNIDQNIDREESRSLIEEGLLLLKYLEREVIKLRFGFYSKRYTQEQIGERLKISKSYVSRIEERAIEKLKIILERRLEPKKVSKTVNEKAKDTNIDFASIFKIFRKYSEEQILDAINTLEELKRKIIELYYGLNGYKNKSVGTISEIFNMPMDKVYKILNNSLKEIKDILCNGKSTDKLNIFKTFEEYSNDAILDAINTLGERRKRIIELRYGLNGNPKTSIKDISTALDTNHGSIYRTLQAILERIEGILSGEIELSIRKKEEASTRNQDMFEILKEFSREQVLSGISMLKERTKKIIELRYGLNGNNVTSVKEIANMFSVNPSNIIGILNNSIKSIRKNILRNIDISLVLQAAKQKNMSSKPKSNLLEIFKGYDDQQIFVIINSLDEKDKQLFELRYGVNDKEERPLNEILAMTGLSMTEFLSNVRRIISFVKGELENNLSKYTILENEQDAMDREISNQLLLRVAYLIDKYNFEADMIARILMTDINTAKEIMESARNYLIDTSTIFEQETPSIQKTFK